GGCGRQERGGRGPCPHPPGPPPPWCPPRRDCGRGPGPWPTARPRPFFLPPRPGGVLVRPDDGRVNQHPPELAERRIGSHGLEQPPQRAGCRPAAEPVLHALPTA